MPQARCAGGVRAARPPIPGIVSLVQFSGRASIHALCAWLFAASWHRLPARLPRGGGDRARVEVVAHELQKRDPELVPQPAFQAAIILRAAEDIADDLAERR